MADLTKATEGVARKIYENRAPQSAPSWDDLDPMNQRVIKEAALKIINDVLEHVTPISPDAGAVAVQMEMLASEIGTRSVVGGRWVKDQILATLADAMSLGESKG